MDYVYHGRTALKVSRLCLGGMNFGEFNSPQESHRIMSRALDLGVNFLDTANVYGSGINQPGLSESIIGDWLHEDGTRRDRLVLATKVYGQVGEGPNDGRLSAYHIKRACEASLKRLKTDHIDLYLMHRVDPAATWDELLQAMDQLLREGKITYVGSSNFSGWHIASFCQQASRRNLLGLVSEQCGYSLLRRSFELEVIPAAKHYGMAITPWAPAAGGLLAGILGKNDGGRSAAEKSQRMLRQVRPQIEQWETLCSKLGVHPANVALAWLLQRPCVTSPIIGPRTLEHLESSLHALEVKLDDSTLGAIDRIFPGPATEAPEAYWAIPGIRY